MGVQIRLVFERKGKERVRTYPKCPHIRPRALTFAPRMVGGTQNDLAPAPPKEAEDAEEPSPKPSQMDMRDGADANRATSAQMGIASLSAFVHTDNREIG